MEFLAMIRELVCCPVYREHANVLTSYDRAPVAGHHIAEFGCSQDGYRVDRSCSTCKERRVKNCVIVNLCCMATCCGASGFWEKDRDLSECKYITYQAAIQHTEIKHGAIMDANGTLTYRYNGKDYKVLEVPPRESYVGSTGNNIAPQTTTQYSVRF